MSDPVMVVTIGDEEFEFAHVKAQEMIRVKGWTGARNRREWYAAILDEDPEALIAAACLVKQRKGEDVRFSAVDFDLDSLDAHFVDEHGRKVEPVVTLNDDGTVHLDDDGRPVPVLDTQGNQQWRDVEGGQVLPFEPAASA